MEKKHVRSTMIGVVLLSAIASQSIDSDYRKLAMSLLGTTLGDPRNSRYCRVIVMAEIPYPAGYAETEVVGFVSENDPKSAVLWDGLRYPIKRVVGPADLDRARKACKASTAWPSANSKMVSLGPKKPQYGFDWFMGNPAAPAIWMLIGEEKTAADLLKRQSNWSSAIPADSDNRLKYWIADRLRARFYECFHNGEDELALALIDREIQLKLEPKWNRDVGKHNSPEQLRGDVRRRLAQPDSAPNPLPNDIPGIVRSLEHIRHLPNWSPSDDPIFDHAVLKGPDLVPALVEAMAHDLRLTRAEVPSRNFPDLSIEPVSMVAEMLIQTVWPEYIFVREKKEADLLAIWERVRGLPRLDKMVAFLEDESLSDHARLSALSALAPRQPIRSPHQERELRLASWRMHSRIVNAARPIVEKHLSGLREASSVQEKSTALEWMTWFASWNWELGRDYQRQAVQLLPLLLERNAPALDKVQNLLLLGMDNGDTDSFLMYGKLTHHMDSQGDEARWALPVLRFSKHPEVREILARYGASFGSTQDPALAIHRLNDIFQRDVASALSNSDFRGFISSSLANRAVVAVQGKQPYVYPVSKSESAGVPGVTGIRVCDHAAYQLCLLFETGCEMDLKAPEAARNKTCAQVVAWLNTLGETKPVKRRRTSAAGKLQENVPNGRPGTFPKKPVEPVTF